MEKIVRMFGLGGIIILLALMPGTAVADPVVAGKVYAKDTKEPVANARVVVSCGDVKREVYTTSWGTYAVDFTNTSCGEGDVVTVVVVKDGGFGRGTGVMEDFTFIGIGIANVWYEPEEGVPPLGFFGGGGGGGEPPLILRTGFIRIIPEMIPGLILDFNYTAKPFYITVSQLYGVLGALDSYPIIQAIKADVDFYIAKPSETLEVLPGVVIARLQDLRTTDQRDAYAVAAEKALAKYERADKAVITRGDIGVDSLAAVAYARYLNAPVLLVTPGAVPSTTRAALRELGVNSTIIIGGPAAISRDVEAELPSPIRIWGHDRYETAVKVAEMLMTEKKEIETVVITDGITPDPVVVMLASYYGAPIVYVAGDKVPEETMEFLRKYRFKRILVAGISDAAESALKAMI